MAIFSSDIVTSAISASIADTAVDVFVYDTSKDSDGGAWRKRTQNTSWYNETLGTATRGTRKEFPAVAVIVAENDKVTIYDGDDPDLPMWMVLNADSSDPTKYAIVRSVGKTISSLYALNGIICDPVSFNGLFYQNFVGDACYRVNVSNTVFGGNIVNRNGGMNFALNVTSGGLIHATVNDVVMTVLPNASIDDATGLPVPTIAVATDGGVSVIKDDGNVINATGSGIYAFSKEITITEENYLWWLGDNYLTNDVLRDSWAVSLDNFPSSDFTWNSSTDNMSGGSYYAVTTNGEQGEIRIGPGNTWAWNKQERNALGSPSGLAIHKPNIGSENNSLIVAITSDYNTGWMHGAIKGAFLSDTDTTDKTNGQTDPDRSVNNNPLQVFGTVTKSVVATGAELVGYSGFSASNYLQQPYNSDLDFGTDDLNITFWFKTPSGSTPIECILHRGDGGTGTWGSGKLIQIEYNGSNLASYLAESAFSATDNVNIPIATAANGLWSHYSLVRSGTFLGVYFNGELMSSTTSTRDVSNTSAKTWIGERPNSSRPLATTSLALFRMSKSALSPEQIKKMYEDEKVLFQENAKATLYGSSDAVTALAYDDTTELLHVGTSAGRSEFQGLRRINNTTDPVTTAISAHDSLIIEQ